MFKPAYINIYYNVGYNFDLHVTGICYMHIVMAVVKGTVLPYVDLQIRISFPLLT